MAASREGETMPHITIYTTPFCPYCMRAKALFKRKEVAFEEIDVGSSEEKRRAMIARAGGSYTVPQIFIGDRYIGGSDDLYALEAKGELDLILQS
jgi:glutaredoxin 3